MEWFDIRKYLSRKYPFTIVIGGRGIGKTYSSLTELMKHERFIYMRRTELEIDLCLDEYGNPFKKINSDKGTSYYIEKKRKMYFVKNMIDDEHSELKGFGCALSTFSNVRGADFSDCDIGFYDEFIPPPEKKRIKNEADAFFNFYETVNRNREFEGNPPFRIMLSSNSTSLNSPILEALGLVTVIEKMILTGQQVYSDPVKKVRVVIPIMDEFMEAKAQTVLYQASKGTNFSRSSLENKFAYDSFANIAKRNITEYTPLMSYENIYIYRHKSRLEYYVTFSQADCDHYDEKNTRILFIRRWFPYKDQLLNGTFIYENFSCKSIMLDTILG